MTSAPAAIVDMSALPEDVAGPRPDRPPLSALVAEAVRQQILAHPDSSLASVETPVGVDDDEDARSAGDLADGVVATHDVRVKLLQDRIHALRETRGSPQLVADLSDRLRRAMAARQLAMTRVADGTALAACQPGAAPAHSCSAVVADNGAVRGVYALTRAAAVSFRVHASGVVGRTRQQLSWHRNVMARLPDNALARRRMTMRIEQSRGRVGPALAHGARQPSHLTVAATRYFAIDGRMARRLVHRSVQGRLADARRTLSRARALLETNVHEVSQLTVSPVRTIPGLWQWEGSTTWTLRPGHSTVS